MLLVLCFYSKQAKRVLNTSKVFYNFLSNTEEIYSFRKKINHLKHPVKNNYKQLLMIYKI